MKQCMRCSLHKLLWTIVHCEYLVFIANDIQASYTAQFKYIYFGLVLLCYLIFFIIKEIDLSTYFQEFLDSSNDEGSDSGENSVDLGSDLNLEHHPLHRLDQVPSIHIIKVIYYLCLFIITPLRYKRVSYFCFSLLMVLQNCERIFLPFFTINI